MTAAEKRRLARISNALYYNQMGLAEFKERGGTQKIVHFKEIKNESADSGTHNEHR